MQLPALAPPPPRLVLLDAGMIAEVRSDGAKRGDRRACVWLRPVDRRHRIGLFFLLLLLSPCMNVPVFPPIPSSAVAAH